MLRISIGDEKAVAFRLPDGTPGLVQERCAHRCASLVLARNEDDGLRCIYHGWKFAPDGTALEIPTEPDPSRARLTARKARIRHWPVKVEDGTLWACIYQGHKPDMAQETGSPSQE